MTPWQRWVASGTALLAIALTLGWFRPIPPEARTPSRIDTAWKLPAQTDLERSSAAQFAATAGLKWLGDAASSSTAVDGTPWTLLGLVRGPDLAVLVKSGSDPLIKRVMPGDTLPDGSRLTEIQPDAVIVEKDGCRTRRPLYQQSQDPPAQGCGTAQDQ